MQHDARPHGPSRLPGRLIYLMGPSGSGKDSLIDHARPALLALGVPVARRVITRSAEAVGEDVSASLEAAFAARRHAYEVLNWPTAISLIDPANTRSIRLAERMGCHHEADFTHVRLGLMQVWRHPAPVDAKS